MARKGFFDKLVDRFDGNTADETTDRIGGYDVKFDDKPNPEADKPDTDKTDDDTDDLKFTKDEIVKLVSDFLKDDPSAADDIRKLVDKPRKTDDIVLDFKAKALEDKKLLKKVLQDLSKEDKAVQKVIDDLATPAPAPVINPTQTLADKLPPLPSLSSKVLPATFDPKRYAQEVIYTLREHPEVKEQIFDSKTDLAPRAVDVFYDERNDELHEKPLLAADIQKIVYARFGGDYDKACGPNGWFARERRIADRYGNPTNEIFPEGPKGSK